MPRVRGARALQLLGRSLDRIVDRRQLAAIRAILPRRRAVYPDSKSAMVGVRLGLRGLHGGLQLGRNRGGIDLLNLDQGFLILNTQALDALDLNRAGAPGVNDIHTSPQADESVLPAGEVPAGLHQDRTGLRPVRLGDDSGGAAARKSAAALPKGGPAALRDDNVVEGF